MKPGSDNVLMVHGAGGGGWEWNVWRRVFAAAGYAVSTPDLQPLPAGLAETGFNDYRAQLLELAAAAPPPVIIGASLGGLLALSVASEARVRALILINPMPPAPRHRQLPARGDYPTIIPWGRDATLQSTRRALPDADDASCLYAFRRWRDESGAVMNAAQAGIDPAAISCPVLVMASELDDDVPSDISEQLANDLRASLVRLPGCSHVGPLLGRQAAACAAQAVGWLNARPYASGN